MARKLASPIEKAGNRKWKLTVNANWARARINAVWAASMTDHYAAETGSEREISRENGRRWKPYHLNNTAIGSYLSPIRVETYFGDDRDRDQDRRSGADAAGAGAGDRADQGRRTGADRRWHQERTRQARQQLRR